MGGFDFLTFTAPFIVGLTVLILFAGINSTTINNLLDSVANTIEQLLTLSISSIILIFFIAILFVGPISQGFNNALKTVAEYPSKILEKFLK